MDDLNSILKQMSQKRKNRNRKDETPMIVKLNQMDKKNKKGKKKK